MGAVAFVELGVVGLKTAVIERERGVDDGGEVGEDGRGGLFEEAEGLGGDVGDADELGLGLAEVGAVFVAEFGVERDDVEGVDGGAERVVDLVGDVGGEAAGGGEFFRFAQAGLVEFLFVDVGGAAEPALDDALGGAERGGAGEEVAVGAVVAAEAVLGGVGLAGADGGGPGGDDGRAVVGMDIVHPGVAELGEGVGAGVVEVALVAEDFFSVGVGGPDELRDGFGEDAVALFALGELAGGEVLAGDFALDGDPVGVAAGLAGEGEEGEIDVELGTVFAVVDELFADGLPGFESLADAVEGLVIGERALEDARGEADDLIAGVAGHALEGVVDVEDAGAGGIDGFGLGDEEDVFGLFDGVDEEADAGGGGLERVGFAEGFAGALEGKVGELLGGDVDGEADDADGLGFLVAEQGEGEMDVDVLAGAGAVAQLAAELAGGEEGGEDGVGEHAAVFFGVEDGDVLPGEFFGKEAVEFGDGAVAALDDALEVGDDDGVVHLVEDAGLEEHPVGDARGGGGLVVWRSRAGAIQRFRGFRAWVQAVTSRGLRAPQ